jgi:hypothetical protein
METKRTIRAKEIVTDIRKGMTNAGLMEKYELSSKGLISIFNKLSAAGFGPDELNGRVPPSKDTVTFERNKLAQDTVALERNEVVSLPEDSVALARKRRVPRNYLMMRVPICDANDTTLEGHVRDITAKGLQVAGLKVKTGDTRNFLIRPDDVAEVPPFTFEAECRWAKNEAAEGDVVAGFEITDISTEGLTQLKMLIRSLTLGG